MLSKQVQPRRYTHVLGFDCEQKDALEYSQARHVACDGFLTGTLRKLAEPTRYENANKNMYYISLSVKISNIYKKVALQN